MTSRPTVGTDIAGLPLLVENQFIKSTSNDRSCRHNVENTEYSNLHHQFLQFINLSSSPLFFDDIPDLEQADEARSKEGDTEEQIDKKRDQHKSQEAGRRTGSYLTQSSNRIPGDTGGHEDSNCGDHWQDPGQTMVDTAISEIISNILDFD